MGILKSLRRKTGMFIGGFEGGMSSRRLKGFRPSRAHVNALIQGAGPDMCARARYLVRNNAYAANAVESWAGNIVGTGIHPSSKIGDESLKRETQELWERWTDESDAEGLTDFEGQQRRVARELYIAGEAFVRLRSRRPQDGLCVPLQLQILPSEMLPVHDNRVLPYGNVVRQGIEFNPWGRRVAYHFYRRHPGDHTDPGLSGEQIRIPAENILHIIDPIEAGQLRGYSRFAPIMAKLFILDQYDDAELDRKKVAALYAGFVRRPDRDSLEDDAKEVDSEGMLPLEPGQLQFLEEGEDITFSSPVDVGGNYEAFQYRNLLQLSVGGGLPYANFSGDMLKANYSNTRSALLEFRRRAEAFQYSVMIYQMCRPIWHRWMDMAVMYNALQLPDFEAQRPSYHACAWLPPRWEWVDPLKDIRAEIEANKAGLKSRTQSIAERGYDILEVDREIAEETCRAKRLGILQNSSSSFQQSKTQSS